MRVVMIILLAFAAHQATSQDLTGIWRGSFSSSDRFESMFNASDRYKLEVQIDQRQKTFQSVTYSYKTTMFYGKAASNGTINPKTGKVYLQETKIVEVKMSYGSSACIMEYRMQYTRNGDEEFLEGTWKGYNEKDSTFCNKGTVMLRKVTTSDFYKEPFLVKREEELKNKKKARIVPGTRPPSASIAGRPSTAPKPASKDTTTVVRATPAKPAPLAKTGTDKTKKSTAPPVVKPSLPPPKKPAPPVASTKPASPPAVEKQRLPDIAKADTLKKDIPSIRRTMPVNLPRVLTSRENEIIRTIVVNTNQVTINIYDNGTIDHDTVSVYLDKKLVISKQMLTTSPLSLKFDMDETNNTHEIIMVAENLGDFPPNTSLMVVKAGDKEYEVRITSNEQKNAVVLFKLEPK